MYSMKTDQELADSISDSNMDMDQFLAVIAEQQKRARKRTLRSMIALAPHDVLAAIPAQENRPRILAAALRRNYLDKYRRREARNAMFSLYL